MKYTIPTEALNREQNSQEKAYEHAACAGLPGHQVTVGSFDLNVVAAARLTGSSKICMFVGVAADGYCCWHMLVMQRQGDAGQEFGHGCHG